MSPDEMFEISEDGLTVRCGDAFHPIGEQEANEFLREISPWYGKVAVEAKPKKLIYVAGSMSQREMVRLVSSHLRNAKFEVFNDWIMPGEETDVKWQEFEIAQGRDFLSALAGPHAEDVFEFDKKWIEASDAFVLVLPAGKSAHIELGVCIGQGKPSYILLAGEPEKWDIMYRYATGIFHTTDELIRELKNGL